MRKSPSIRTCAALAVVVSLSRTVRAEEADADCEEEDEYGKQGSLEIGGSVGVDWSEDTLTVTAAPTFGWFIVDRVELSARVEVEYELAEDELGNHTSKVEASLVFEPSYHLPIREDLLVLGGLGVGGGYDGEHPELELIPRVGLNIELGHGAVLTPAVSVPILIGEGHGENGNTGVDVGVIFEAQITTTL